MMIRIKDPAKAEMVRRSRGDKSPTETVNKLIEEAMIAMAETDHDEASEDASEHSEREALT